MRGREVGGATGQVQSGQASSRLVWSGSGVEGTEREGKAMGMEMGRRMGMGMRVGRGRGMGTGIGIDG